jgi:cytochrome c-type biogenesis protein CcmH
MVSFILVAVALTAAAIAVVVIPLVRPDKTNNIGPAGWAAAAAAAFIVVGAAVLYASWTNWSWRTPATSASSPQTMVANLARRLERNPDDLQGWLMLGRSYTVLEQYPLAQRAYQRADRLAGGKSVEALVGLAEALMFEDAAELDGRAGQLVERALALDDKSAKALFYGAAAAMRRGDLALARTRFVTLLALNPPENVRPILQEQITAIDERLAASGPKANTSTAGAAPAVRVHVTVSAQLRADEPATAPLFVIVRDPKRRGPPLAVKRLTAQFPQNVELTSSDSMLAGQSFEIGQQVEVVARIARSGSPLGASGDPYGQVPYHVGRDGVVNVVIDRLTP